MISAFAKDFDEASTERGLEQGLVVVGAHLGEEVLDGHEEPFEILIAHAIGGTDGRCAVLCDLVFEPVQSASLAFHIFLLKGLLTELR